MKKRLSLLIVVVILIAGLSNYKITSAEEIQKLTEKKCNMISEFVERERKAGRIPGVAIGIVYGNEIVYTKGFGVADQKNTPVTAETPFYIGSVGKTFTALAIRQLEGEGKISSEEPVTKYISWFTLADNKGTQITVGDLLAHTSGLSTAAGNEAFSYNKKYSIEETVRLINKRVKTNRPPGESYEYSNLNYIILGLIIEYVSGMSYQDYIEENIFAPIGMENSFNSKEEARKKGLSEGYRDFYGINIPIDCPYPSGQVPSGYQLCSVKDMSEYMVYFLNNGYVNGKSILPGNQLLPPVDPVKAFGNSDYYYDLEWGITNNPALNDYNRFYGFLGATPSFNSAMLLSQVHRYGVVVLVNQRGSYRMPELTAQLVGNGITDILLHDAVPAPYKRAHNTKLIIVPLLVLLLSIAGILSLARFKSRLRKPKQKASLVTIMTADIILPVIILIGLPVYYDNDWSYFLSSGIDSGLPMLVLCMVFLITGLGKLVLLLMNPKKSPIN